MGIQLKKYLIKNVLEIHFLERFLNASFSIVSKNNIKQN